jgi:hypothetical protein
VQNFAAVETTSAITTGSFLETTTDSFTTTATDSTGQTGTTSSSLTEIGGASGGSYSLSSYVWSSVEAGTLVTTDTSNATDAGMGSATSSDNGGANECASAGGISDTGLGNGTSQSADSFSFSDSSASAFSDQGSFTQGLYQSGSYTNGSWALACVAYSASQSDTWSQTEVDTRACY